MNKSLVLFILIVGLVRSGYAQFGPIGFDFGDPYVEYGSLRLAVRLSTESNIYCPAKTSLSVKRKEKQLILTCSALSAAGGQLVTPGKIELQITDMGNSRFSIEGKASHPTEKCHSLLVFIKGIDVKKLVSEYPQAGGVQEFRKEYGIMTNYPDRNTTMPLAFVSTGQEEWFFLSKDEKIRRKGFAAFYDHLSKEPVLILSHDEDARRITKSIDLPAWHIGTGASRLDLVQERCRDIEKNYSLIPHQKKASHATIDSLKLVVYFHGMHWTGHQFNTFDQMSEQLEWICRTIPGKNVLAFLPAWDGRYYGTYPLHQPEARMGGESGLKRFVEKAHSLGVKVVLMLGGPNLATFSFLKRHKMTNAALKSRDGYPYLQDWLDWNADLSRETMGYIMNFGHPAYQTYMVKSTGDLFDNYKVDGVFLDGASRWANSPDYSPYEGVMAYAKLVRQRYPNKLLMGEDGYDAIYGLFDLFHTSGGPMGLENYMLRYTRQFYYLSYPAENGSAGVHEIGWSATSSTVSDAQPGYTIPTLSFLYGILPAYEKELIDKINSAKKWSQKETTISIH